MKQYKEIILRPEKEQSLQRFHPWIFSGAIAKKPFDLTDGEVVKVLSSSGTFLGLGHYQTGTISVRILSFDAIDIDIDFYVRRLKAAYLLRKALQIVSDKTNSYRLIHGEGDNLPGLIIDIYDTTAVLQAHSLGMHRDRALIAEALLQVFAPDELQHIFYKSEGTLPFMSENEEISGTLFGKDISETIATENGLKFHVDWLKGQKTGFFLDQRENRALFQHYAHKRRVLNMFCYTGSFSVYALQGGALEVASVDSSAKAITLTNQNIALNFGNNARHQAHSEDAFKFLKQMKSDAYDAIVLDPPAFAKHRGAIKNALQGYKKLNRLAFDKIARGGILFTFSCSQAISKEQFRLAVFSAAALSGRNVRVLHQLTQPGDHPINIFHPEGEYLKGLVLYIE